MPRKKAAPAPPPEPKDTEYRKLVSVIEWDGVSIEITWEPDWMNMAKNHPEHVYNTGHLELRSVNPPKAKLPVTDTGYRSHFIARETIEAAGGPDAWVLAWLDAEAKMPPWRKYAAQARQLDLFN